MKTEAKSENETSTSEEEGKRIFNLSRNSYSNPEDPIEKDNTESKLKINEAEQITLKKAIIKAKADIHKANSLNEIESEIANFKNIVSPFFKWSDDEKLIPQFLFENEETSMFKFQKDLLKSLIIFIRRKCDTFKEILYELENTQTNPDIMKNFKNQFFYFIYEEIKFVKEKLSQQTLNLPFNLYQDFDGNKYLTLQFSRNHPYSFGIIDHSDSRKSKYIGSLIDGKKYGLGFLFFPKENYDLSNWYFGQFDNKRTGIGQRAFSYIRETYIGEFLEDQFHSFGKYYLPMKLTSVEDQDQPLQNSDFHELSKGIERILIV